MSSEEKTDTSDEDYMHEPTSESDSEYVEEEDISSDDEEEGGLSEEGDCCDSNEMPARLSDAVKDQNISISCQLLNLKLSRNVMKRG